MFINVLDNSTGSPVHVGISIFEISTYVAAMESPNFTKIKLRDGTEIKAEFNFYAFSKELNSLCEALKLASFPPKPGPVPVV